METLLRKIEEKDLPKIKVLIQKVFQVDDYIDIERLGGMTNHSYKVTLLDGNEYFLRLPGDGTEELINRKDEKKSTELACKLRIDSELLYFGDDGEKVMKFISNSQPMDGRVMKKKEILEQAAAIFRKLHNCGKDTGVRFEVFEMAAAYEKIIYDNKVILYDDYVDIKNKVMNVKATIDAEETAERVPCHNDCLMGNWILDSNGKLYLIDWEYSGMNEAMWDLSCLSIEADYTEENDNDLLMAYFGRDVTLNEKRRFIAAKIYVDYLWTLWGLTRVPYDGKFMQQYAYERYLRLKKSIYEFEKIN